MDYLYTAPANEPAPEFRAALAILSRPQTVPSLSILAQRGKCPCCKEPLAYAQGSYIGECANVGCIINQPSLPL